MMVSPSGYANWKARSHGAKPGGKRLSDDHLLTTPASAFEAWVLKQQGKMAA
jgi:hypothetical protein